MMATFSLGLELLLTKPLFFFKSYFLSTAVEDGAFLSSKLVFSLVTKAHHQCAIKEAL